METVVEGDPFGHARGKGVAIMRVYYWLRAVLRRRRLEQDLRDEFSSHLAMDIQERIEGGESPENSYYGARTDFGSIPSAEERVRETWGGAGIDRFLQDFRYGFRQLKRNPGFALVAVLTLGLGIGATTAIFTIVDSILVRPLPYKDADRLVRIVETVPPAESFSGAPERTINMSPESFLEWRSMTKTLSGMAMERPISATFAGREPVRLSGLQVSAALFPMLQAQTLLGRLFEPGEEKPGLDNVVILSYGAWQRVFGGNPQILGRVLTLDDAPYTLVGIMPREFAYPDAKVEFWTPLALPLPGLLGLPVMARVRDGTSMKAAAEEADSIGRYMRGESPTEPQPPGPSRTQLMTVKEELIAPIRLPLVVFVIGVGFVLLVACVNVATLFLARATTRSREITIRVAVGAGRWRLFRQLLTESLILALLGGAVGSVLAFAGVRLFAALGESLPRIDLMRFDLAGNTIPRVNEIGMDMSAFLFTVVLTAATGFLLGIVSALQIRSAYTIPASDLRTGASSTSKRRIVRSVMVVGQIGVTAMLLLGAGLLIKSFVKLVSTNVGYDSTNVLTFKIPRPELPRPEDAFKQKLQNAFAQEVAKRIASIPGVQAAAFTNGLPMVQGHFSLLLKGRPPRPRFEEKGRITSISADYFRVMRIRVVAGREFTEADRTSARSVYVINKSAAREYFPGVDPIGKIIGPGGGFAAGEIVGVVEDTRQTGFETEPEPQLFLLPEHMIAFYGEGYYFAVRTTTRTAAIVPTIRSVVRDIDPTAVIDEVATMNQILANSVTTPRSYAVVMGVFSLCALILATIGLYGVLTHFVTQRRREIGIRLALGAERQQVLRLILGQGLEMSVPGVALGLLGGAMLTRYLQKMLFGVSSLDPATFLIVALVFITVALLASYLPARAAMSVDPLVTLRYE
jgi:predicted permease